MTFKENIITIGISSRALFNLEKENMIYEEKGIEAYIAYQIDHEEEVLKAGVGFSLVKNLLSLNSRPEMKDKHIEVIIMSRSCPDISIRIFNSIKHYGLNISRGIFTGGEPVANYVKSNNIDLYLSSNKEDVSQVLKMGIAAARVHNTNKVYSNKNEQVRIAFDFDCVLGGEESEYIFQNKSLSAFEENEEKLKEIPVKDGPFKEFVVKLGEVQRLFNYDDSPIRIAICTARNYPAHERVIKTLRNWGIRMNEAYFLGGYLKSEVLEAFNADIFFDDSIKNIENASEVVPSCHVS